MVRGTSTNRPCATGRRGLSSDAKLHYHQHQHHSCLRHSTSTHLSAFGSSIPLVRELNLRVTMGSYSDPGFTCGIIGHRTSTPSCPCSVNYRIDRWQRVASHGSRGQKMRVAKAEYIGKICERHEPGNLMQEIYIDPSSPPVPFAHAAESRPCRRPST
jgi:hypothetical protein